MEPEALVRRVNGFSAKSFADQIKYFAWLLHTHRGLDRFQVADIAGCFDAAHLSKPANLGWSIEALRKKSHPDVLKDSKGYRLAQHVRAPLEAALGRPEVRVSVERLLTELPGKLSDEGERLFLTEALTCYAHGAFRAAIVMVWNLAYDHVVRWVLADAQRLAAFNGRIAVRSPKKSHLQMRQREDFEDLKEDETLDIVAGAAGISANMKKILKDKLGRRNMYAHPSILSVGRSQVDDMVTDLVNNVILQLPL